MSQAAEEPLPETPENYPHDWVAAAEVLLTEKTARHANLRGSFVTDAGHRIRALDIYCRACKRYFDDVVKEACSALIDNQHLRGGPIDERKKRKPPEWTQTTAEYGKPLNRRGIESYVLGYSRFG